MSYAVPCDEGRPVGDPTGSTYRAVARHAFRLQLMGFPLTVNKSSMLFIAQ